MLRSQLIKKLSDQHYNLSRKDIEKIFDEILNSIISALSNDEYRACEIRSFGRFSVKEQKARIARNPATGAPVNVSAKKKIRFKASSILLKRLNEN